MDVLFEFIYNPKDYLIDFVANYGLWVYALIFLVVFSETGFVVFPFLPGDGFLFTIGVIAGSTEGSSGELNIWIAMVILIIAAFLGNTVNYHIGRYLSQKILEGGRVRFVKQKHLESTHDFFEKHGQKAVIISRFLPVFRTFVPFVAGISKMSRPVFLNYTFIGGVLWVLTFCLLGFFLGTNEWVQNNLSGIFLFLVVITIIPTIVTAYHNWKKGRTVKK